MEVLLRFLYGATAVMAVPRRCHGGHGGAAVIPLRIGPTAVACGSFEHVKSFRRAPAKVRNFDIFPRCYGEH